MLTKTKVLVLGVSGMLGNAVFRMLSASDNLNVVGTARSSGVLRHLAPALHSGIVLGGDVENLDRLAELFAKVRPEVVINCIGLVKQLAEAGDPLSAIPVNSLLPHRLARLCAIGGARLIHVSTDCVFSGRKGAYLESDIPDAEDLYGRSKLLGEVDYPHAVTLRTSIIGHELSSAHGLVNWFLSQSGSVSGFTRAIFSGLPTVELAGVIRDFVLPDPTLSGVYHVSVDPIAKYDLLKLVAQVYSKQIEIVPNDTLIIDRSLDSSRFREATGYLPDSWDALVKKMHAFATTAA